MWRPARFVAAPFRPLASDTRTALVLAAASAAADDANGGDAPARALKGDGFTIPNCVELLAEFERIAGGVVDRAALA